MTLGAVAFAPAAATIVPRGELQAPGDPPGTLAVPRPPQGAPRVALVLGSGSSRGFAHIGVLAALEESGIRPGLIVGTSAGSMVGALSAAGLGASDIEIASRELDWTVFTDVVVPRRGLVGGERIENFIRRHGGDRPIESLPVPFAAVATDVLTGDTVVLNRGNLATAVRASSSVPVVFEPVAVRGRLLVDGSLSAPTPVRVARQLGADVVIAVNVAWSPEEASLGNPVDMIFQTLQVMTHNLNRAELAGADIVIAPDIRSIGAVGPANRSSLVTVGREAGLSAVPAIRRAIAGWPGSRVVAEGRGRP